MANKNRRAFFRDAKLKEVTNPRNYIVVNRRSTSLELWDDVLLTDPVVHDFGGLQVAVRRDKAEDPGVMLEVERIRLAQQVETPPRVIASLHRRIARLYGPDDIDAAIECARQAQLAKPSSVGSTLLKRLEAEREAQREADTRRPQTTNVWEDADGVEWTRH